MGVEHNGQEKGLISTADITNPAPYPGSGFLLCTYVQATAVAPHSRACLHTSAEDRSSNGLSRGVKQLSGE